MRSRCRVAGLRTGEREMVGDCPPAGRIHSPRYELPGEQSHVPDAGGMVHGHGWTVGSCAVLPPLEVYIATFGDGGSTSRNLGGSADCGLPSHDNRHQHGATEG